jgi:hypothetical protein
LLAYEPNARQGVNFDTVALSEKDVCCVAAKRSMG